MIPGNINTDLISGADEAAYQISRSLRFNSADSAYLSRTPASAGNRKTWTWSGWVKRSGLGTYQRVFNARNPGVAADYIRFNNDDTLELYFGATLITAQVFRDVSSQYHLTVAVDTTQATSSNRVKLYVNGTQVTTFATTNYPSQNADTLFNATLIHNIGTGDGTTEYFNGYLADIHFIDGQALTPSSFAETNATTGQWVPKAYTGSYGTNGFRLDFSDNSAATATTLGKDRAGSNNWTPNNLSVFDGITSVAAATGALPIYNTTDTYGTTKGSGTRTDPNASSLVLAISMDGTNGGTTFTDDSPTIRGSGSAKTITRFNATTSTASSKFYGSSGAFNGTNAYLSLADSPDWAFGTSDFTVETWAYVNPGSALYFGQGDGGSPAWVIYGNLHIGPGIWSYNFGPSTPTGRWFHWAMVRQGTSVWFYINGVQYGPYTGPSSWSDSTDALTIGQARGQYTNGYFQDFRIYKGVAKYTSNFNPPSSTQNPTVAAGNDSLVDTPTSYGTDTGAGGEVRGNYCVWNPLSASSTTLTNGNLDASVTAGGGSAVGTVGLASGKWYWEVTPNTGSAHIFGISDITAAASNRTHTSANGWGYYSSNGQKYNNNSGSAYGATFTTGDVIGVALDMDAGQLTFYKNGTSQGLAFSGLTGKTLTPAVFEGTGAGGMTYIANFGQRPFAYTAPSGFKALCDTNLPAPTIARPSTVMTAYLYTGNGSTAGRSLTGAGFSPDLAWIKDRSAGNWHQLRSTLQNGIMYSNDTAAEQTSNANGIIGSLDSDGFTLSTSTNTPVLNTNNNAYVAWLWDAGASTVTNTQGSITSSVRANASAGFSIVTATIPSTGTATIGHGLNVAPSLYIIKPRSTTGNWTVYHKSLGAGGYVRLNTTDAFLSDTNAWNNTAPTSSVLTLGTSFTSGLPNATAVVYCFAPVAGYSSFGSYTGNGSADGPFVFTGFRPRWVLIKGSSFATTGWAIYDAVRNTFNVANNLLTAESSSAETNYPEIDLLSNGFKLRGTNPTWNYSGQTHIYAAFAESSFAHSRAR